MSYPTPTYGFSRLRASLSSPYFLDYLLYASDTVYTQSSGSAKLAHHPLFVCFMMATARPLSLHGNIRREKKGLSILDLELHVNNYRMGSVDICKD